MCRAFRNGTGIRRHLSGRRPRRRDARARDVQPPRRLGRPDPTVPGMIAAALRGVSKRFGETIALDQVDIGIEAGDTIALLGPNGAGKTTALAVLLGLRRPDEGRAEIFGVDPWQARARLAVGVTPQEAGFPPTLRVREI